MSTKEVIKTTTTISKRWRHLWTRLPTLVFIDEDFKRNIDSGYRYSCDITEQILYIDKTLDQCPTNVNLKKFQFETEYGEPPTLKVNSWIHYAITSNVQKLCIKDRFRIRDDELFFNNSCLISLDVSGLKFNPPNGTIRWDKLKFLCIDEGKLDEDLIGKILSGSPCLETLELNDCHLVGRIPKSLFGNFGVLERLSCDWRTYTMFSYEDELFLVNPYITNMKLLHRVFNPPTGSIGCDKLKFLCIHHWELDEDEIEYILSESPFLETLQLDCCCGFSRIDVTSKSVKNLVLSSYTRPSAGYDIGTLEINAPYISSLTIEGSVYLEEILLQDVSSLVKADLNYGVLERFMDQIGLDPDVVEENLLRGLLSSLGHVNEIVLGTEYSCDWVFSRLEATGFQFRKGSYLRGTYPDRYRFFPLNRSDESIVLARGSV